MNEIKESEIETKNLYGASAYAVDEEGNVYRKTHRGVLRKLKTREVCSKTYVTIRNDHGRSWSFDTKRIAQALFKQPIQKYTKQDILELFDVKMIPDWARYVITPYGAVYCIDPPKRGRNAGGAYMLREFLMGGHPYVTLYHSDGTRRNKRVRTLVEETWGEDSALPDA
tara:strand:- start:49 stop:555 length:507 start_codon:yes stop_codon:yes gene_type:complete